MPDFGAAMRSEWPLDPAITYLNHGTVGVAPNRVLEHRWALAREVEANPARFMIGMFPPPIGAASGPGGGRMRQAATAIAPFVGADPDGLVFVRNITEGANAVLRSLPLGPGDQIVVTDQGYGGVTNAAAYAAQRAGADVVTIPMPRHPTEPGELVAAVADGLAAHPSDGFRLLIIDHILWSTSLIVPIADVAAIARDAGVRVLVDAAHAPGQFPVDIASYGVDWYAANLHKWAWAPRSCGVLWTAPEHRDVTKPVVTSWGYGRGYTAEFDMPGTTDVTIPLTAPFAVEVMRDVGLEAIYAYNHDLAMWSGAALADAWGTAFTTPDTMVGALVSVALPRSLPNTPMSAATVKQRLADAGFEAPISSNEDGLVTRISAQVYVDRTDIERFGAAVLEIAADATATEPPA